MEKNYLERIANQRGVRMQAVVEPGLILLRADRGALFTLLKNLLENAIQHSRAGGAVQATREIATVHGRDLQARRSEPGMIFDLKINSSESRTSGVRWSIGRI